MDGTLQRTSTRSAPADIPIILPVRNYLPIIVNPPSRKEIVDEIDKVNAGKAVGPYVTISLQRL